MVKENPSSLRPRLLATCAQLFVAFIGGLTGVLLLHFGLHVDMLTPQRHMSWADHANLRGVNIDAEKAEQHLEAFHSAMHRAAGQLVDTEDSAEVQEQTSSADQGFSGTVSNSTVLLSAIPQRWRYWEYCGGSAHCAPVERYGGADPNTDAAGGERFLLFDSRGAGWNNERQSIELAFAMAFLWRRTLVLPAYLGYPGQPQDLWQVNNSFDVEAMNASVKVMLAQEFVAYAKANPHRFPGGPAAVSKLGIYSKEENQRVKWKEWTGWFKGIDGVVLSLFKGVQELIPYVVLGSSPGSAKLRAADLKQQAQFQAFATKSRLKNASQLLMLSSAEEEATALRLPPRILLGNFYTQIFVPDPVVSWQLRSAVRRSLRLRSEFFLAASAAMDAAGLTPGEFGAIHNRQGDFQNVYKKFYLDPVDPGKFLLQPQNANLVKSFGKLYMASKTTPAQARKIRDIFLPGLLEFMPEPREIYGLAGPLVAVAKKIAGHLTNWRGIVEMIICSQAGTFVGSWASTYTGYIHRLRGYNLQITDKRFLYTDASKSSTTTNLLTPSWTEALHAAMIGWQREWPEGFEMV